MKTITIEGVIGWDVFAQDVRQAIREANGEDLTIEINSPGGVVTEGIAIYNAIKNAPGYKKTLITGMAASMASYIAIATDRVQVEPNSVYMVHNASVLAAGDHNALRKAADLVEGMSKILASAYIKKTSKTDKQIKNMMDQETFLFGPEIKEEGFADEVVGEIFDMDKQTAVSKALAAVAMASDIAKRLTTERDTEQAAAMLQIEPAGVASVQAAGPIKQEVKPKMTEEEIKALETKAREEGVKAERARVAELKAFAGHNADADKAVEEAIASGKHYHEVAAQLVAAVAKGSSRLDADNAPVVETATVASAAGASGSLTDDEMKLCKALGLTHEQYKKTNKVEG